MFEYIKYGVIVLGGVAALVLALLGVFTDKLSKRLFDLALMLSFSYAFVCTMFRGGLSALSELLNISFMAWGSYFPINTTGFIVIGVMGALAVLFLVLSLLLYKKNHRDCPADRKGSKATFVLCFVLAAVGMFYANSVWHYNNSDKFLLWLALDRMGPVKYSVAYQTLFNYKNMLPQGDAILFSAFGLAYFVLFALLLVHISRGSYTTISLANIITLFTLAVSGIVIVTPLAYGAECWLTPTPWIMIAVTVANRFVIAKHFGEKIKISMFITNQLA